VANDPPLTDAWKECGAGEELRDLVGYMAANPSVIFSKFGLTKALKYLEVEAHRSHSESLFRDAIGGSNVRKVSASIRNLVWISRVLRIPIHNLLIGEVQGTNFDLLAAAYPDYPPSNVRHRGPWRDRRVIEMKAWKYFEAKAENEHPSLTDISKHVGLSTGGFRYLFPKFAGYVVDTHFREELIRRAVSGDKLSKRVQDIIQGHAKHGAILISRYEMQNRLIKERRWSKNRILAVVKKAFDVMESENLDRPAECRVKAPASCRYETRRHTVCSCRLLCSPVNLHT
jgi:AraC-like DNA-binding protein